MKKLKSFQERYRKLPVSPNGLLDFPGQKVVVPTEDGKISMKGIPYPVIGKDDTGHTKLMFPEQEYKFPGSFVYECPLTPAKTVSDDETMKYGGELKEYQTAGEVFDPNGVLGPPLISPYEIDPFGIPSGPQIPVVDPERKPMQNIQLPRRPDLKIPQVNPQTMQNSAARPGSPPLPKEPEKPSQTLFNGKKFANRIMTGMSLVSSFLEKKEYEEQYKKEKQRMGNSNAFDTEFQGFSPYGDYTVNAGQGQNFRPNENQYPQSYKRGGEYKEGDELDLSDDEIAELKRKGYKIDLL